MLVSIDQRHEPIWFKRAKNYALNRYRGLSSAQAIKHINSNNYSLLTTHHILISWKRFHDINIDAGGLVLWDIYFSNEQEYLFFVLKWS